jgi:hypothetical protein
MPFNLKGGRPKSMKQGTYWVQRHVADQKREAARQRRIATADAKAAAFNERYSRILQNCMEYHLQHQGTQVETTQKQFERLTEKINQYNELKSWIDGHIDAAKASDLNKLATLGRAIIVICAKTRKQAVYYDASEKKLTVANTVMNFG